jgi:ribosomal protein S18 acetylase RimI-like enzyme
MRVVAYEADHLRRLQLQESQAYLVDWIDGYLMASLEDVPSFSVMNGDTVLGCAGISPMWRGRGLAWAYISSDAGEHFMFIHRATARFLDAQTDRRIEMAVDVDFKEGHRWAQMLGFKLEAERMRGYLPSGGDCSLYARTQ